MATQRYHIATLQVLIPVEDEAGACDYVSETLRETFPDWSYVKIGGQRLGPSETFIDPETYEEGDAFD